MAVVQSTESKESSHDRDNADWRPTRISKGVELTSGHHVLARYCNNQGIGTAYLTGPADFPDGRIHQTKFTTRPTSICRQGDILVTVKGSGAGSTVMADREYCISRQLMAISPVSWDGKFLFYSLKVNGSQLRAASAGLIPGLSRSDILDQEIPVPRTTAEQRDIAAALADVDALLDELDRLIAKKRDLKQAAMQQLLTGKVRLPGFKGEWETKKLGDLGTTYGGLTGKSKDDFGVGEARYVTFLNVLENEVAATDLCGHVKIGRRESQNRVLAGDVLFNGTSETAEDLARGSLVPKEIDGYYLNSFCFGFRFAADVDQNGLFLAYFFRGPIGRKKMNRLAQGATRYNMSKRQFLDLEFDLPSGEEQTAIAAVLSDIDAETKAFERQRAKTADLKQAMMQELLTGRTRLVAPGAAS